jgi:hypothetical protein
MPFKLEKILLKKESCNPYLIDMRDTIQKPGHAKFMTELP